MTAIRKRARKSIIDANPTFLHKNAQPSNGRDYETRLDKKFNHDYIEACYEEKLRYIRSGAAQQDNTAPRFIALELATA